MNAELIIDPRRAGQEWEESMVPAAGPAPPHGAVALNFGYALGGAMKLYPLFFTPLEGRVANQRVRAKRGPMTGSASGVG